MCTAVAYQTKDHYFGRNLDMEFSYDEEVIIMPRHYPVNFRNGLLLEEHKALIGVACVADDSISEQPYPLYYDAVNECGIAMAALNFPDLAYYGNWAKDSDVVAPFEFIPWVLCQCATMEEVRHLLSRTILANLDFSEKLPVTPLHWMISAGSERGTECITVESTRAGLKIYENPVEVLTNSPDFQYHMTNLTNYMSLSARPPVNNLTDALALSPYSRGMGGLGLPGDMSSASRFIRAAFVKLNSLPGIQLHHSRSIIENKGNKGNEGLDGGEGANSSDYKLNLSHSYEKGTPHAAQIDGCETASVNQFFHILSAVEQPRGCVRLNQWEKSSEDEWENEITVYSSCCNTNRGIYYYKTYDNSRIHGIDMYSEDLKQSELIRYPMKKEPEILIDNH